MVPHDTVGLARLFGGKAALRARLEYYFFRATFVIGDAAPVDLATGYVGGHCQGNEPAHHAPWLFNSAGAPWLTQRAVDAVQRLYTADANGLPGNDDVGQTSAWLVWATLGIYPVDPCGGSYELSRPLFSDLEVSLGRGDRKLHVFVENPRKEFVEVVFWNGVRLNSTTFLFEDLKGGGQLRFRMGHKPVDWSTYLA